MPELTIEQILAGEDRNTEFLSCRPADSLEYLKHAAAFANGPGGRIVFGAEGKTRPVAGIPKDEVFSECDAVASAIAQGCEPPVIPSVFLQTADGKPLIVAEIAPGLQRPYCVKALGIAAGTFIRVSGTTRPAGRELTAEMYCEAEGRPYDRAVRKDLEVTDAEIESLCREMHAAAIENAKSETQRKEVKPLSKNILISWGLLAEDKDGVIRPTNGWLFLQGLDPFHSGIQCGVFKGRNRAVFVDRREYGGPLWRQTDEAFRFVLRNIRLGARLSGIFREDSYELPPDSLRDLIVSAAMNCSLLQPSRIQVAVFDDRVEISSPGGLMPGVTVEKMKAGFAKIRNQALARAFAYMNLTEDWGSGIPKLRQAMAECGLSEPELCDMETELRVRLPRNTPDLCCRALPREPDVRAARGEKPVLTAPSPGVPCCAPAPPAARKPSSRDMIAAAVRENPSVTQAELEEITGLSRSGVRYIMRQMREEGILRREGATKKGRWLLA